MKGSKRNSPTANSVPGVAPADGRNFQAGFPRKSDNTCARRVNPACRGICLPAPSACGFWTTTRIKTTFPISTALSISAGSSFSLSLRRFCICSIFSATCWGISGLAILAFTVRCSRSSTLPLLVKSYRAMAKMKALQPEMKRIQERFADDKMRQSAEMMELYKREKANPASGCLPTLDSDS